MPRMPSIDTSWQYEANPANTPWVPGFRFTVLQDAKKVGRSNGKMRTRRYSVSFGIDRNGLLEWRGGVKPSVRTLNNVAALYAEKRPGSNGGPA